MKPLFDVCKKLPSHVLREAFATAGGAFYLVSPDRIAINCTRLLNALKSKWHNSYVAYSYKTNYAPPLVEAAASARARHEVVSWSEYSLAKKLGAKDANIIFNGPGKSDELLEAMAVRPVTLIVDSHNELHRLAAIRYRLGSIKARLGMRLSPSLSFQNAPSRFGIELSNELDCHHVRRTIDDAGLSIQGIHLHFTGARDAASFLERIETLVATWYRAGFAPLKFIDCGGGFSSDMPAALSQQLSYRTDRLEDCGFSLGDAMSRLVDDPQIELIVEPGTGILADAGVFVTKVLDVKTIASTAIAVVDGTIFNVNPLHSATTPIVHRTHAANTGSQSVLPPVRVCGNSCMETDTLVPAFDQELAVGDFLVFAQKGAYADCMATPFITGIPALMMLDSAGAIRLFRSRTSCSMLDGFSTPQQAEITTRRPEALRS